MIRNRSDVRRDGRIVGRESRYRAALTVFAPCLAASVVSAASHAQTNPAGRACVAPLEAMAAAWNAIGFAEPATPSVTLPRGANGRTATAGQLHSIRNHLGSAARACRDGRDDEALQHIGLVREALGRAGPAANLMAESN
jgi:hypothetical protein